MEIQLASSSDFVEILFLLRQCIKDMNEKGLKQWNTAYPSPEMIRTDINNGVLYLYKELGVAKGMISLTKDQPEGYEGVEWKSKGDNVLYIKRFAVHPYWQDSDVGEKLIAYAENYAKENKFTSIRMDVLDSYPVDDNFFSSKKFDIAGTFHSSFQKLPYTCYEKSL